MGQALEHASNAGDKKEEAAIRIGYALVLLDGPAPLDDVGRCQQENLEWARANYSPRLEAASLVLGGRLQAMRGDFDGGDALIARGRSLFEELGVGLALMIVSAWAAEAAELAGNLAGAEREFRAVLRICEKAGDKLLAKTWSFELARLLDSQGRHRAAEKLVANYEADAPTDDRDLRVVRLCWHGRASARRGDGEEATRLAQDALALAPPRDSILFRSNLLMDIADVFSLAGHLDRAAPVVEEALHLYEQKGSIVSAGKARARLTALREAVQSKAQDSINGHAWPSPAGQRGGNTPHR